MDAVHPGFALIFLGSRQQQGQRIADVGGDADLGRLDLVQFRRVDVDMDDVRLRAELRDLAGRPVVEAGADSDQQIAFVERQIGLACAVHAQHAERKRVIDRHCAERHQGHHGRQICLFRKVDRKIGGA